MVKMREILDMSVAERIVAKIDMPAVHEQELDRRLARFEKGETAFTTWEAIKSELHAR